MPCARSKRLASSSNRAGRAAPALRAGDCDLWRRPFALMEDDEVVGTVVLPAVEVAMPDNGSAPRATQHGDHGSCQATRELRGGLVRSVNAYGTWCSVLAAHADVVPAK
jgi:hypothetical protein